MEEKRTPGIPGLNDKERAELFASRLEQVRKNSKQTNADFAALAGISPNTVSMAIRRQRIPNGTTIALLCEAHGIRADWLLGLTEEKEEW